MQILDGVHQQEMVHTMKTVTGVAKTPRRQHERSFKAALVEQCLVPGASVAAVALAGGVNANMLFKWRREHLHANALASSSAVLVPVQVAPDTASSPQLLPQAALMAAVPAPRQTRNSGVIELEIAGAQLRLRGPVDEASLCCVLRALRGSK